LLACPSLASDVVDDLSQPSANLRLRLTGWFRIYRSLTGHNLDSGPYPRGTQAQSSPCLQVRMFQLKFQFRQNVVGGPDHHVCMGLIDPCAGLDAAVPGRLLVAAP